MDATVRRVITDSREIQPGDLFVAIRGERFDGHTFLGEVRSRGATACLCDRDGFATYAPDQRLPCILVENTVSALGRLAAYYRACKIFPRTRVIAVTGSNGKTTTKFMIHHVLSEMLTGRASPRSFNNQIGVPLTLLSAEKADQYVVVEIGTNALGEIAALAAIAKPDVAVITSIGEAHLAGLGSLQAIAEEKFSILDHLATDGLAVINADYPELRTAIERRPGPKVISVGQNNAANLRVRVISATLDGTEFELSEGPSVAKPIHLLLPLPGLHHGGNAAAAFAVGRYFGIKPEMIAARLASFSSLEGRTKVFRRERLAIVDDSYNANPASVRAAIETLGRAVPGRRILVLGDMMELGPAANRCHREAVQAALAAGIELVLGVGESTLRAIRELNMTSGRAVGCRNLDEAIEMLPGLVRSGDTIWVKGSRAMQLDRLVSRLKDGCFDKAEVA